MLVNVVYTDAYNLTLLRGKGHNFNIKFIMIILIILYISTSKI